MKLRKQLLFVSLITLTLPWAGFKYIQGMERTLKHGQAQSMSATAKAVAAYFSSSNELQEELAQLSSPSSNPNAALYFHHLPAAPILDGYFDEWAPQNFSKQQFVTTSHPELKLQLIAGIYEDRAYMFIHGFDQSIRYFNPTLPSPKASDHITLTFDNREFVVFASGPGNILAVEFLQNSLKPTYAIKGKWLEASSGYKLEISFPANWLKNKLAVSLFDVDSGFSTGNNKGQTLPPAISRSSKLEQALSIFSQNGSRMAVSSNHSKMLAIDGSLKPKQSELIHGFIPWFYRIAISDKTFPDLDKPHQSGSFDTPEISASLNNLPKEKRIGWYKNGQQNIVRATEPIRYNGHIAGAIVIDQNADSLVTMTSSAFYQLLFYSVITTSAVGAILVIYATWLSLRIRKLSKATADAVSDTGKITEHFPILRNKDELGDLSRNYAQLLSRLREYTNYLRTLSSKLSHELRTPLAIVRSSLDNLEHENLSEQAKTYAGRAKEGTTRLSNILNAMSAASRVEQAISGAEMEEIPCDELLKNLKAAYADVYKHVRFKTQIRDDADKLKCMASGELLVQMLDKLVDNAADFCPANGLIELGLYRHQQHIVFTVHNEGPPLPKHMQGQLFDSMVSVREKGSNEEQGHLGLGLYIVRLIVDFHRGEVRGFNATENDGVIFEVRLPT